MWNLKSKPDVAVFWPEFQEFKTPAARQEKLTTAAHILCVKFWNIDTKWKKHLFCYFFLHIQWIIPKNRFHLRTERGLQCANSQRDSDKNLVFNKWHVTSLECWLLHETKSLSIDFKFTLDNYREVFCMKKIQGLAIIEILSRVSLTSTTDFYKVACVHSCICLTMLACSN